MIDLGDELGILFDDVDSRLATPSKFVAERDALTAVIDECDGAFVHPG
jgi:hypothetical protein